MLNKMTFHHKSIFTFGKHKGKTVYEVMLCDFQYIIWINNRTQHSFCKDILSEIESYQCETSIDLMEKGCYFDRNQL